GRATARLPLRHDLGDLVHDFFAVADDEHVDEVGERFGIERAVATRHDQWMLGTTVRGANRRAGQVDAVEDVRIDELSREVERQQVEVACRAMGVDREQRHPVGAHQRLEIHPGGVGALGDGIVPFVQNFVKDLEALVRKPNLVCVGIHQEPRDPSASVDRGASPVLAADVAGGLLHLGQQRLDPRPKRCHLPGVYGQLGEAAHVDVEHQAHRREIRHRRRPAVGHERQGMPVIGMIPIVMPTFSKIWKTNMARMPTHSSVPNRSRASVAVRQVRQTTTANRARRVNAPTKPNSSPTTVKMKSVCCSGTNDRLVWVPLNRPFPNRPPEPIAALACARLYAECWGSLVGLANAVSRSTWYCLSTPSWTTASIPTMATRQMAAMCRGRAPATTRTPMRMAPKTRSVPRSGCR